MRNRIIIYTGLLVFLSFSCTDFLSEEPLGDYPVSSFYQTAEHAILAINASYEPAAFANSENRLWVFGDVASDDAVKGGLPGDQADIGFIDDFQTFPDNGNVENIWGIYYEGISRCNNIIKYVPQINMDDALKQRILGEAYFLRGYYYFHLTNIFGNIPKILEPKNPDEMQVPGTSQSEMYAQIELDFSEAFTLLSGAIQLDPGILPASEKGRATPGAAKAFLAKTYLFHGKYAEAAEAASEVKNYGYGLMNVYQHNFNVNYENNIESIFEIQHLSGQSPVTGSRLNQWLAPRAENGYGFCEPTQSFIDEFEVTSDTIYDPRLDYSVGRGGGKWFDNIPYDTLWSFTTYSQKKNIQPISEVPVSTKGDGDLNFTVMRYAEVLLIQAEALCEDNRCDEALIPLNEVRRRARESYLHDENLPGYGTIPADLLPDITTTEHIALRNAIRHERRVELGLESVRFFDVIRYGEEYANAAFSDKENFRYATHKLFPIPQSEMDTNKEMEQNDGYN